MDNESIVCSVVMVGGVLLIWSTSRLRKSRAEVIKHLETRKAARQELLGKPHENDVLQRRYIRELEGALRDML